MARKKYIQTFTGGMNTVLAPGAMSSNQYFYMLNCNVTSTADGNVGNITSPKGTVMVEVLLPAGENRTIGHAKDEESNKMYYAVWNSLGYHSWYQFDAISLTAKLIFQSITYTGNEDILKWEKGNLIIHANIIDNNLLYWVMKGHPARKFNIQKSLELSEGGYGSVILEEYTRGAKKTLGLIPYAEYFTNESIPNNSVYGYLFQFCARYIYDDGEYSVFSDFSNVAVPSEENITGSIGIPKINNGIRVNIQTGGMLVKKIEIAMRKTDPSTGGVSDFVSIVVLDKEVLGIENNTDYFYDFYNNNTYLALPQATVNKQQSDFPKEPMVQEFTYNRIVYGNYKDGYPAVKVDFYVDVEYDELFIPDGTEDVLNDPILTYTFIEHIYDSAGFLGGGGWRNTVGRITVGPDVKAGNVFTVWFTNDSFSYTVTATLSDTSETIAAKIRSAFSNHSRMNGSKDSYVRDLVKDGAGFTSFQFRVWNNKNKDYIGVNTSVIPVNYATLKDTGNSVLNEKLGSSWRYAIRYEDQDDGRSLAYGGDDIISIKTINELQGLKKVITTLTINHKAPSWAKRFSIVRTRNLTQEAFIQILVQKVITVTTTSLSDVYHDVILGSLYAYQGVHPNTTLGYEFKKGDRIKLKKVLDGDNWTIPNENIEYEVIDYYKEIANVIKQNVIVDGSAEVKTAPDANNIGNNIIIEGNEREIMGVNSSNDGYILNSNISINGASSSAAQTFPSFTIINRRGVLRIKMDPLKPIVADGISKFSLVEIYRPTQTFTNSDIENYYDIGYKFEIYSENGNYYHRGNFQDQTISSPAVIKIGGVGNYVRNRELITNNSTTDPQMKLTSVEDSSFSDFYVSNLSSYGRPTKLDDSRGVVFFDDRLIWSSPFIEDTRINGLNIFNSLDRVDYNDKYGSIQRIIFYEGRMYIFKFLKTGWVPVLGNIFTDTIGSTTVAISSKLLPDKMEYFLWEGGVGNNPESIVKEGNSIHGVSPNSEIIFEIGGAGLVPSSKIYGIDNEAREIITRASKGGVNIIGAINRKNNRYVVMIPEFDLLVYSDAFNISNSRIVNVDDLGNYQITSPPSHGVVSFNDGVAVYQPSINYSGMDYFSYKSDSGLIRQVCINVLSEDVQLVWRAEGAYCVIEDGERTGMVAYSVLNQFDNLSGDYTGESKPNVEGDPDYVAPYEDLVRCPLGLGFIYLAEITRKINSQSIIFEVVSVNDFNILIKKENDFSSETIAETGTVSAGTHTLSVPMFNGNGYIFMSVDGDGYDDVTEFTMKGAYLSSASFDSLSKLTKLVLDQSSIPNSHNNQFTSLNVAFNSSLKVLKVIKHELAGINLWSNPMIEELDLSFGRNFVNLDIEFGGWSSYKIVRVHECLFTYASANPAWVDSVITNMDQALDPQILQYGLTLSSGVKPSKDVLPEYNSLVSKGTTIIGKAPSI